MPRELLLIHRMSVHERRQLRTHVTAFALQSHARLGVLISAHLPLALSKLSHATRRYSSSLVDMPTYFEALQLRYTYQLAL
jgi:hypothetical protein